jgi:hypothetical protein
MPFDKLRDLSMVFKSGSSIQVPELVDLSVVAWA